MATHYLDKQLEAYNYLRDETTEVVVYGGGAGGGKTWLICDWLLQCAHNIAGSHWFMGRAELKKLRATTNLEFQRVLDFYDYPREWVKFNGQDNFWAFQNGSRITLLDLAYKPSDPLGSRFGSFGFEGGAIDECAEVGLNEYSVLRTRINRGQNKKVKGKILISTNPSKNHWLYTDVYKPWKEGRLPENVAFIPSLAADNKYLNRNYIEGLKAIKDNTLRARLLSGEWEYDSNPSALMNFDAIHAIFSNAHVIDQSSNATYITADIAMQGADQMVVMVWRGFSIIDIEIIPKNDGKEAESIIRAKARKFLVPEYRIAYDADGVGTYLGGYLRTAKAFHNGASPKKYKGQKQDYANLKSQCYFMLAEMVNANKIHVQNCDDKARDKIIEELEAVSNESHGTDNKLKVTPKQKIKDIIHRSPDLSDCMMMRMYFVVNGTLAPTQDMRYAEILN